MNQKWTLKQSGFTIAELLISIVVISILATLSVGVFTGITQRAKDASDDSNVSNILKKIAEHHAVEGEYRQDILLANNYPNGGSLSGGEIFRLTELGMKPDMLRNQDSPASVMNSYVFDQYNQESGKWLSDIAGGENISMFVEADLPAGYTDWDDVFDDVWAAYDDFYENYLNTHPYPEGDDNYEAWAVWDAEMRAAFGVEYPDFVEIFENGSDEQIQVPKTQVYFVRILGEGITNDDQCYFSGGEYAYCRRWDEISPDVYQQHDSPITGMEIRYFSRSTGTWKTRTIGNGEPFRTVRASYG